MKKAIATIATGVITGVILQEYSELRGYLKKIDVHQITLSSTSRIKGSENIVPKTSNIRAEYTDLYPQRRQYHARSVKENPKSG